MTIDCTDGETSLMGYHIGLHALTEELIAHLPCLGLFLLGGRSYFCFSLTLRLQLPLIYRIEHGVLLLFEIDADSKATLRDFQQQIAEREPRLPLIGQRNAQSMGSLLVVGLHLGCQLQRLGKDIVEQVGKVLRTALDTLQEVWLTQGFKRHRVYLLLPFVGHTYDLLTQVKECLVVQLLQRGMTMVEELSKDTYHRLLLIEQRAKVEELQQQVALIFLFQQRQLMYAALGLCLLLSNI